MDRGVHGDILGVEVLIADLVEEGGGHVGVLGGQGSALRPEVELPLAPKHADQVLLEAGDGDVPVGSEAQHEPQQVDVRTDAEVLT